MVLSAINLKVNYTKPEYAIADGEKPVFNWGVADGEQAEYRLCVTFAGSLLWDSGFVSSSKNVAVYEGKPLPSGAKVIWILQLKDKNGNLSNVESSYFKTACFDCLCGEWIESPYENDFDVQHFCRSFELEKRPQRAVLYHCGLGLSKAYLNGGQVDDYRLQPAHTNYAKSCFYITTILDSDKLHIGKNEVEIAVGGGWRTNYGSYLDNMPQKRKVEFMGKKCLWAMLVLYFDNGEKEVIATDRSWQCATKNITYSHLFNGEVYDESAEFPELKPAAFSDFKPEKFAAQYIEPVCVKREVKPRSSYRINDITIYDFGENMAGVVRLRAKGLCKNVRFVLRHSEEISETGGLFCNVLRSAKAEDVYVCRDGECDIDFSPQFTYHGFQYATLQIEGEFDGNVEVSALNFYTDIDTDGFFKCGNQTVTELYNTAVRTERANLHSVATDCPQRDERMAWMNDATVRFMTMPYNFSCARLFEKIVADITNEQSSAGAITCTAPFVYGERPADPVCCAYLVAAKEHYKMTGSTSLIEKYYDNFKAWCDYLKAHTTDGIVNYSYYGDWAGPDDTCYYIGTICNSDSKQLDEYDTGPAISRYIPGEMMSTAIYFMTLSLMADFATIIGKNDSFEEEKERIQTAFLEKWFDEKNAFVGSRTQGEQALALYTGIIPENRRKEAAKIMADEVIAGEYRIKTGNLVTPMLLDMLSAFGYADVAWKVISATEYPSFGYMLAHGATTMWERFELKKNGGMNSHNHPMYGAAIGWLYRQLAGFKVITPNSKYILEPKIPDELLYFEMRIPLLCDSIYLKCEKKYGSLVIFADIPFSANVTLKVNGKNYELSHGFNAITENL